jgi:hypothetical protein
MNGQVWKYTEYRDDPAYWSTPPTQDVTDRPLAATPNDPGVYTQPFQVTVKNQPVQPLPRDYEMYNLTTDPLELNNLALDSSQSAMKSQLAQILAQQRTLKRLAPDGLTSSPNPSPAPAVPPAPGPDAGTGAARHDPSDDTPRRLTETQRQQREQTNQLGRDDYHSEGNVLDVQPDAAPPFLVIGTRDGRQTVHINGDDWPDVRVGDYVEVDGVKENEQLFEAETITVTRAGQRVR